METPAIGSVVLIPFPFSNLTQAKLRPAIILAGVNNDDWIFCQITSNPHADIAAIKISDSTFLKGSLQRDSYVRPGKIFTGNTDLIIKVVGILNFETLNKIVSSVVNIFEKNLELYKTS